MSHPTSAPPAAGTTGAFIAAMGGLATSVTVVGAAHEGDRAAQTVSAMCSVSVEPPMLLVCVHRRSPVNRLIRDSGRFSVNVLATRHDHVADTFAGRPWPGKQRWDFTCGDWVCSASGTPRLADALAFFDCAAHSTVEAGSHLVHIGLIDGIRSEPGTPLIYTDRTYAAPSPVPPSRFPEFPDAHPDNRYVPEQQAPARKEASA